MAFKCYMTDGEELYTINKSSRFNKAKKIPKYKERKGAPGKYKYIYETPVPVVKKMLKKFKKMAKLDKQIDKFEKQVGSLEHQRQKIVSELEPTFKTLKAQKVQFKKHLMSLIRINRPSPQYKGLFSAAYNELTDEAQKKIDKVRDKFTKIQSYLIASYKIKKAEDSDEKLDKLISDLKESLQELLEVRTEINNLVLKGKKIKKSYAALKKWNQPLESQWPTYDPNITQYPDEDFETRKKPVRHTRMSPTGRPYFAGKGPGKPKEEPKPELKTPQFKPVGVIEDVNSNIEVHYAPGTNVVKEIKRFHNGEVIQRQFAVEDLDEIAQIYNEEIADNIEEQKLGGEVKPEVEEIEEETIDFSPDELESIVIEAFEDDDLDALDKISDNVSGAETFEDAGLLTRDKGVVVKMKDDSEFQVTVNASDISEDSEEQDDDILEKDFTNEVRSIFEDGYLPDGVANVQSFKDAGLLTRDSGLVFTTEDGNEFQVTIVQSGRGSGEDLEKARKLGARDIKPRKKKVFTKKDIPQLKAVLRKLSGKIESIVEGGGRVSPGDPLSRSYGKLKGQIRVLAGKQKSIIKARKRGAKDIEPRKKRKIGTSYLRRLADSMDSQGKTLKEFVDEAKKKGATNEDLKGLLGWPARKNWLFLKKPWDKK